MFRFLGRALLGVPPLAGMAGALSGCQALTGIEVRDEAAPEADVGAGGAAPGVDLRYCDELPALEVAEDERPDWSCVDPVRRTSDAVDSVHISGTFSNFDTLLDFELCRDPLESHCDATHTSFAADGTYTVDSTQEGHGVVTWARGGATATATLWHTVTEADQVHPGETYLLTREEISSIARIGGLDVPLEQGVAMTGAMDCNARGATGVRFSARSARDDHVMGTHFSIHGVQPTTKPTDPDGAGGIGRLEPGFATIYAYVGDGCIVAEADIQVDTERTAYVILLPNGLGRGAASDAEGAGGNGP